MTKTQKTACGGCKMGPDPKTSDIDRLKFEISSKVEELEEARRKEVNEEPIQKDRNNDAVEKNGVKANKGRVERIGLIEFFRENLDELSKGNPPGYVEPEVLQCKYMQKTNVNEKQYAKLINLAFYECEILLKESGRYYALRPKKKAN